MIKALMFFAASLIVIGFSSGGFCLSLASGILFGLAAMSIVEERENNRVIEASLKRLRDASESFEKAAQEYRDRQE